MKKSINSIFSVLACTVLMACSGGNSGGNTPENIAKEFVEQSYKGNADSVIAMIHIPEKYRNEAGAQDMVNGKVKAGVAKEQKKAEEWGGVDTITSQPFTPAKNDDKRGHVVVETKFKQGKVITDSVKVIQTENGWKINL